MTELSSMNRRAALALFAGAIIAGCATSSAGASDNPIRSGTYVGKWKDGTRLKEQVIYGEGHIRMTRLSGGAGVGNSALFEPIGPKLFRNVQSGSTITIKGKRRFIWRNSNNQNAVKYKLKK